MVRDRGVEPPSSDWKSDILAIIQIPQMPLNSDFILHLPRFTPAGDFGWSVYTTRQMCLMGLTVGIEPTTYRFVCQCYLSSFILQTLFR